MCLPVSRSSLARLFIFQHTQRKKRARMRSKREWGRGSEQSERFTLVPTPSASKLPLKRFALAPTHSRPHSDFRFSLPAGP